ncbi:TPA: hypothetical protein ACULKM_005060, partial [Escherichia coli]|uniref:hypothetical protein n=2 Tax=Escherichia coli TaxID=562 RepID=UPI001B8CB31B
KGDSENISDFHLMMPLCEMTVNDALVPAHNSKHHNRSDSILAVSDNYSRFSGPFRRSNRLRGGDLAGFRYL